MIINCIWCCWIFQLSIIRFNRRLCKMANHWCKGINLNKLESWIMKYMACLCFTWISSEMKMKVWGISDCKMLCYRWAHHQIPSLIQWSQFLSSSKDLWKCLFSELNIIQIPIDWWHQLISLCCLPLTDKTFNFIIVQSRSLFIRNILERHKKRGWIKIASIVTLKYLKHK